ncbi:MAG: beta-propeller domain-containing protein [Candidatus Aenigmarchaeota archaeon]|nr:beta-propeller domain-containing protein [Candidatus Aenigmarchaeota archaeon]
MRNEKLKAASIVLVIVLLAAALSSYQKPIDLSSQAELKRFSSPEELNAFLASAQQTYGSGGGESLASAQATQSGNAAKAANDYSSTNVQVAGVDESDFVKNDGRYIYAITGGNVTIIDAYPAESAKIVGSINTGGTPVSMYVSGDKLVVFSGIYDVYDYATYDTTRSEKMEALVYRPYTSKTSITVYDISDRAAPTLERNVTIDGNYMDSRMTGGYVYAIINEPAGSRSPVFSPNQRGFPDIYYFDAPSSYYTYNNIVSLNVDNAQEPVKSKVFLLGGYSTIYASQSNIYMTYQKSMSWDTIQNALIESILPLLPGDVATKVSEAYNSNMTEYEKHAAFEKSIGDWLQDMDVEEGARVYKGIEQKAQEKMAEIQKELQKTVIHKISISNGNIEYKTHGEVPGTPLNQFSMDEYNGYFRIATTVDAGFWGMPATLASSQLTVTNQAVSGGVTETVTNEVKAKIVEEQPPEVGDDVGDRTGLRAMPSQSKNNVYVLDGNMNVVGSLEDLAPGERIYSARFMGDRAYLVTFVQVDPLFVIDLSQPAAPRVLGELKIPGVSDYLHPYDETHLIGIGKSTDDSQRGFKGLKVSLFDVSDVANPKETATYELGERGTDSEALHDHKAFLFDKSKGMIVIPASVASTPYNYSWQGTLVLNVDANSISERGRVVHSTVGNESYGYYYPQYPARRALYIGDTLYSVAQDKIIAADLATLAKLSEIAVPHESWDVRIYGRL